MSPQRIATIWLDLTVPPPPPADVPDVRRTAPDPEAYLRLYRAVGDSVGWDARWRMTRPALAAFLAAPTTDLFWLFDGGHPAGLCEFDAASDPAEPGIELVHFGLVAAARGRGLGLSFLRSALTLVWAARRPGRVWLHTDTEDDPRAVGVYRAAGFVPYREGWIDYPD